MLRFKNLLCALALGAVAVTAEAGVLSTRYFMVDIPAHWEIARGPEDNGTNFMTQFTARDRTSVTVAISAGKMPAADVAEQTMDNLRAQSGARFEPLKEEYGVLSARYEIHGGAGVYFFGADGEQVAVINILGSDPEEGIKFLRRFVPRTEKLFPKF